MTDALFDIDTASEALLDLRADDTAWASCRWCHVLSTVAGLARRGHEGPESVTCTRLKETLVEAGEWP